jgi:RNA polymerase sigma-70 factor (ECF subfamily)
VPQTLPPHTLPAHLDSLTRAARAMTGSREDADDLVQDTLLRVLARERAVDAEAAGAYLHQALRNQYVSSLRRRDRRPRTSPLESEDFRLVAPPGREPSSVVATREVIGAIASLPADQRNVVAAVDVAGFGYKEAAASLRIPLGTVMSRLYRGRARLAVYSTAAAA